MRPGPGGHLLVLSYVVPSLRAVGAGNRPRLDHGGHVDPAARGPGLLLRGARSDAHFWGCRGGGARKRRRRKVLPVGGGRCPLWRQGVAALAALECSHDGHDVDLLCPEAGARMFDELLPHVNVRMFWLDLRIFGHILDIPWAAHVSG